MKNSQNNKTSQNIINNKNLYLHQEIQEENKRIKDRFKVLVEKEEEIKEEIKLFEDIKNYEEKLKIFEKKIKKKKLEIITDWKTPFLVIKWDKNKKFDISKKHKNLLKEFDEIFEEYSEIIKKIHIDTDGHYLPNISILENIYILHLIVMSENENFIKEFKSNINIAVILYDYKKTYRKYNFIEKVFWRKINIENLRLSPYLENYDFFKDKVNNINEKIFELFKKENNPYSYMNDYTQSIFNIKNEELSNLVKNYLIEKNDFENIYKYLWEFEVNEDLFEKLKSSLLSEKYFDFSANNCSKNYKEKTKKFNKKFLESLNLEEFLEVFKNLK